MGIAPVFWASFSDRLHVRRVLLFFSMIVFAVASLGAAFINNIWGLVVLRCIQAVGSSCGQSVGAGVIAVNIRTLKARMSTWSDSFVYMCRIATH